MVHYMYGTVDTYGTFSSIGKKESLMTRNEQAKAALVLQPAFTCLKLAVKTLEQGVKYVQS